MNDTDESAPAQNGTEHADPLLNKNMGELVDELLEEKKILEEKNRKLAAMLDLCAKNSAGAPKAGASDLGEQLHMLKKSISNIEKKLEKTISSESSSQSKAVLDELKARFSAIDEKIAAVESLRSMDKKLEELQAEIHAKRVKGASIFGRLGAIAGGVPAPGSEEEDEDIMKKLDTLEEKVEKLSYRLGGGKESGGVAHKAESGFKKELEKIAAIFSREKPAETKAGEPTATPMKPETLKVPEEVLESMILEGSGEEAEKMRIKVHEPQDLNDASKIQEDIRTGHLILVNIKGLRQNDMELLKRIVERLKKTCGAVDGNIAGMGDNYLIIMPKNVQLHKGET